MNDYTNLLQRFSLNSQKWLDYYAFLNLSEAELSLFLKLTKKLTFDNFDNTLKIYIPNKKFPAISITGAQCKLNCEHCNRKYLDGMRDLQTNEGLKSFLYEHYRNDGVGALISGGCDVDGSVPLLGFVDTIKEIKRNTNLIINVHTGLLDEITAKSLAEAKIDMVSFDITMDKDAINEIYHLDREREDYKNSIELLKKYDLNIVPHICVGLYFGKLHKELEALKYIKESGFKPSLIVIIALIPPKDKENKFREPSSIEIAKIIAVARFLFPESEISLGCMRPKAGVKIEIEKYAIQAGITRIELPSLRTLKWLKRINPEINFKYYSSCCAIPNELESRAISSKQDLKHYKF
jgi:uncharacterized radical SAM superfamily protein